MKNELKPLPLSIQTFADLIEENRVYVDKTEIIHQLVTSGLRACFLSRPRRFGKSLTITTLESIFLGKKALFDGLVISKTDYNWPIHPVIRLDMKAATYPDLDDAKDALKNRFEKIAVQYNTTLPESACELQFQVLIESLHEVTGQKVVVLIDEYDKPLINQLESENLEKAKDVQKFLKSFYGVLKSADEHLRFVFITGVSKFTKVSVFSDLNHLTDLTMNADYATICGYTQEELEDSFAPWIKTLAEKEALSRDEILDKIKTWYNGYRLTEAPKYVYNPWSTLHLFNEKAFKNYWFETGTPTFLTNMMKKTSFDMSQLQVPVQSGAFSTYDIGNLAIMPLLFQTGFLTIKGYDKEYDVYILDFPNHEVARAFTGQLIQTYCEIHNEAPIRLALREALEDDDLPRFFEVINNVYANIPSHLHQKVEGYYHSIFIAACQMAGVPVDAEQSSSLGRSDAVLKSPTTIYVVEFKLNGTADNAIEQIHKKKYMEKYRYIGMPIVPVGVSFDYAARHITDVKIGEGIAAGTATDISRGHSAE